MAMPYFLAAVMLLVAWEAPIVAAVGRWTSVGPNGGWVNAFAVDPQDRSVIYAATGRGGVFKTTDGAATWAAVNQGLPDGGVVALAIDPATPSTLYAAGTFSGLFVSGDAGAHWRAASIGPYLGEMSLACDPGRPNTVFIANGGEVWMSGDRGRTWRISKRFPAALAVQIAADPAHSLLLALVRRPGGFRLHGSADHGGTWEILSAALPLPLYPDKWQLAVDPESPGSLYLAYSVSAPYGGPSTVATYQSNDIGGSWHAAGPGGLPVAVGPAHVVYAGRYRSTDRGRSWVAIAAPPDTVQALAVGSSPDAVYAGTSSVGVLRSLDGGRSWQASASGLRATWAAALAIDPSDPARLYVFDANQGFLSSRDGGAHWRGGICIPFGPCAPDLRSVTLAVDPVDTSTIYMASPEGLYKSTDRGGILAQMQGGIGCLYITAFVLDPTTPATLYAAGALGNSCAPGTTPECTAFKSLDGGASWDCLRVDAVTVAIAPSSPSTLYAVGHDRGSGTQALSRTTDQGATWEVVNAALPVGFPNYSSFPFLVVDPAEPLRLYGADIVGGLWRSVNGGRTWREIDHEGSEQLLITIDPIKPGVIYAASSEAGVVRSSDFGRTWKPLLAGLPSPGFFSFSFNQLLADPRRSGTVYLATISRGVLSYTVPKGADAGGSQQPPPWPMDDE